MKFVDSPRVHVHVADKQVVRTSMRNLRVQCFCARHYRVRFIAEDVMTSLRSSIVCSTSEPCEHAKVDIDGCLMRGV